MGGGKHIRKTDSEISFPNPTSLPLCSRPSRASRFAMAFGHPWRPLRGSGQGKLGRDEEMVAVRSNKEMELTPALTPIAPYKSQTGRWKRGIIPSLHE